MNLMATRVADILIVGGGIAGLSAALGGRHSDVVVVNDGRAGEGGSSELARGGIAAAVAADDSPQLHRADTETAGAGLCDPKVVRALTEAAPSMIDLLWTLGVSFDLDDAGEFALGREAAHSRDRILHADGDATGEAIVETLVDAVRGVPDGPELWDGRVVSLIEFDQRVVGAVVARPDGTLEPVFARSTILATGGVGALYGRTTNPDHSRGDGIALAHAVGADLRDLEFVQFHPTALDSDERPMHLLTEALRGAGATLVDARGDRIMKNIHPDMELAPRDIVARAVFRERWLGREVYLDVGPLGDDFAARFPQAARTSKAVGWPDRTGLPVCPVAHYHMGGVSTDLAGRTNVSGLWAVGEVACTGLHGANRLASNSLLESLVFGLRAGRDAATMVGAFYVDELAAAWDELDRVRDCKLDAALETMRQHVGDIMWSHVGIIRTGEGLEDAVMELDALADSLPEDALYARNVVQVAQLMARSAQARTESRGAHFRADYPSPHTAWSQSQYVAAHASRGTEPAGRGQSPAHQENASQRA
ncbi:MAG: L-aspartate oxidase [Myxococcota bacterium]